MSEAILRNVLYYWDTGIFLTEITCDIFSESIHLFVSADAGRLDLPLGGLEISE